MAVISKEKVTKLGLLLLAIILLYFGFFYKNSPKNPENPKVQQSSVVSIENDKQIIRIFSKGGYFPAKVNASAGLNTVIRIETQNSFDCGNAFQIPSLNITKSLPQTGITDIEIPSQVPGSEINGFCSMGMYQLQINFN